MLDGYVLASGADVLRSAQKDREYVRELTRLLEESVRGAVGGRAWGALGLSSWVRVGSLLYYWILPGLTGRQTLGEEYCDVFEVDAASGGAYAPSWKARGVLAAVHALGSEAVRWTIRKALRSYGLSIREDALQESIAWLQRAHLALFYLNGKYYEFAKRLAGIRYLRVALVRRLVPRYHVLGVLLTIQVVVSALLKLQEILSSRRKASSSSSLSKASRRPLLERIDGGLESTGATAVATGEVDGKVSGEENAAEEERSCALCLSTVKDPALTECGHVFCWDCISEWCSSQDVCPLCRQSIQLRGLLCLYQY